MLEFKDSHPKTPTTEEVIFNGEVIGEIWLTSNGYQCYLTFGELKDTLSRSFHGIAKTKLECIKEAYSSGLLDGQRMVNSANWLKHRLEEAC